jgi:hypothetical protein
VQIRVVHFSKGLHPSPITKHRSLHFQCYSSYSLFTRSEASISTYVALGPSSSRSFSRMCDKFHTASLSIFDPVQTVRYPFQSFFKQFNLVRLIKRVILPCSYHKTTTYLDRTVCQQTRERRIHCPPKLKVTVTGVSHLSVR